MNVVIIVLLVVIIGLLLHINNKIPPRDYVKEAINNDQKQKDTKETR
ncbi:hypothetical protein LQV63_19695 [Paenibacillus profundus]|uniref:YtzI protein n=1 Tax=Paenibacillus profundus TaxID=1173085 RepID=A0ABS8YKQ2_9BACL|nr:hypothetical protein [Paenibacillus profundus]MCE5171529.1 hypothetical protein [Paenibacillus profundus]